MPMQFYEKLMSLRANPGSYILTAIDGERIGEKAIVADHRLIWVSETDGFFEKNKSSVIHIAQSGLMDIDSHRVYMEWIRDDLRLIVCGAGHVSLPVIQIGKIIGWNITCIEDRSFYANQAYKAGADTVICASFADALEQIPEAANMYFVIVTRSHQWDLECLRRIVARPHAYVGMMGSRHRVEMIRERLLMEGIPDTVMQQVFAPIGVAIDAETPEEIAVSIWGEIIKVKNQKDSSAGYPKDIMKAISELNSAEGQSAILATIVAKKGSAPRKVGTKMLILQDGRCVGTIGGGNLEALVVRKAKDMFRSENHCPVLDHAALNDEKTSENGMVCGGTLDVFMEFVR